MPSASATAMQRLEGQPRVENLDVLRAAAALMIVAFHFQPYPPFCEFTWLRLAAGWHIGVDVFFVLSGYLVGALYWRELRQFGSVEIRRFWVRRWLRTIPPYLVVLQLYFLANNFRSGGTTPYDPNTLLFLQNYSGLSYFGPSWSLCVEEHFYLAAPLLLRFVSVGTGSAHLLLIGATAVPGVARIAMFTLADSPDVQPGWYHTHLRCDLLVLGVWLAYVKYFDHGLWRRMQRVAQIMAIPALVALIGYQLLQDFGQKCGVSPLYYGLPLVGLCTAAVIVAAEREPLLGGSARKVAAVIAGSSYSLYMTHYLVLMAFVHYRSRSQPLITPLPTFILLLLIAIGVGYVCSRLLEVPATRFRERWAPRRDRDTVVQAVPPFSSEPA